MTHHPKRPALYTLPNTGLEQAKATPQAVDLEEAVLGAIMFESDCVEDVLLILTPEMFYKIEHQKIFSAIEQLYKESSGIDILTVTHKLKFNGDLELCGGAYHVSQLTDRVSSSANAEFHARVIQQKFIARELIRVSGDIYQESYEDTTDVLDLLDKANNMLADIDSSAGIATKQESNSELVRQVIEDAERASQGSEIVGLSSGIPAEDRITSGLEKGKLYILAARPAMGKSAKATQHAYRVAVIERKPVLMFSLEMTSKELMLRLISTHTGIDSRKIKSGRLSSEDWDKINASVQELIDSPLEIVDSVENLSEIRKKCILKKKKDGLEAVFIDYLQLIRHKEAGKNREQEISEISRTLKGLSKLVDCPVIALAQLSRAVETRGGTKRPMLSDLRESGQIEADADVVMFLYRPEYYGIDTSEEFNCNTEGLTELIIAKNRGGSTGTAPMRFHKETTSFSNWDEPSFGTGTAVLPDIVPETYTPNRMPRSQEFGGFDDFGNIDDKEEDVF